MGIAIPYKPTMPSPLVTHKFVNLKSMDFTNGSMLNIDDIPEGTSNITIYAKEAGYGDIEVDLQFMKNVPLEDAELALMKGRHDKAMANYEKLIAIYEEQLAEYQKKKAEETADNEYKTFLKLKKKYDA
jgi:hypothetical protein